MSIGEKLYQLRKREGISQTMLADSIGVSRQAISKWEQDSVTPDTANLIKLCTHFKVSLEYFTDEVIDCEEVLEKKGAIDLIILVIGVFLIVGSFIITYPMQIAEYTVKGEMFDNALNYLTVFPLNLVLAIGVVLSIIGGYSIFAGRKK